MRFLLSGTGEGLRSTGDDEEMQAVTLIGM